MAPEEHAEPAAPTPLSGSTGARPSSTSWADAGGGSRLSGLIIVLGLVSFGVPGASTGASTSKVGPRGRSPPTGPRVSDVQSAVQNAGVSGATVQILGHGSSATVQVQADLTKESTAQQVANKTAVTNALARVSHISPTKVSLTDVGPTWGSQISEKAVIAVFVFFIVVVIYISFRFEWKMAMAALIAVIHDLLITAGVYSLAGFQVTPDTVIALLTILGYSLYDTVVVFDRVKENSRGQFGAGRMTYEDIVNLSMNQTLARSINTSLVAILPVLAVLVIGAQLLGATTLQYFGLALVIGLTSGAYSSIFIAAPVLSGLQRARGALHQHPPQAREPARRCGPADASTGRRAVPGIVAAAGPGAGRARRAGRWGVASPGSCGPGRPRVRRRGPTTTPSTRTTRPRVGPSPRPRVGRVGPTGPDGAPSSSASSPRRPPPRPRKGKGAKKGGKRR